MPYLFIGAPFVGILTAFAAVIAEQFLAVGANIILHREIVLDVYTNLTFFVVAAAIIEESFKYFAVNQILRQIFDLRRFKSIFGSVLLGLFFGFTEAYLILLTNGKKISEINMLGGNVLFALLTVIIVHVLTTFLISILIAARNGEKKFGALRAIFPAAFVHLLYNFLIIQKGDFTNWLVVIALAIVFLFSLFVIVFNFRDLD